MTEREKTLRAALLDACAELDKRAPIALDTYVAKIAALRAVAGEETPGVAILIEDIGGGCIGFRAEFDPPIAEQDAAAGRMTPAQIVGVSLLQKTKNMLAPRTTEVPS
jgi:hypothetical protein